MPSCCLHSTELSLFSLSHTHTHNPIPPPTLRASLLPRNRLAGQCGKQGVFPCDCGGLDCTVDTRRIGNLGDSLSPPPPPSIAIGSAGA